VSVKILTGDALERLRELPAASANCCVTSPPYWGLRDYGVDGQIGLEETPDEWCRRLVDVFREVRRVLRDDGTLWVNVGDSYAGSWGNQGRKEERGTQRLINGGMITPVLDGRYPAKQSNTGKIPEGAGYKPKDLIGAPWMLAFALRADGWYLRRDIIWHKPNPIPESVADRPTSAHEYVFLLSKSARYWYDGDAIREPYAQDSLARVSRGRSTSHKYADGGPGRQTLAADLSNACTSEIGANARSVWSIATKPFPEAHFATFPPELARRCILAGCPDGGTVIDPFGGAGTTGLVADRLHRNAVMIELNPDYAAMARRRLGADRGGLLDLMEGAA
jgi:DNA modification methylase